MHIRTFGSSRFGWRFTLAAVLTALISGGATTGAQRTAQPPVENVLEGVIDLHHHSEPDERDRNLDTIDAAMYARMKGMRGAAFKSHSQQTATTTWLAARMVPGFLSIPVIDLNLVHGGLNKYAVDNFALIIKKPANPAADIGVVMLPSDTSCYQKQVDKTGGDCVAISKDGQLLPQTLEIIALVKKHGLVLASGHASPDECVMLAEEAQRQGVPFTVTHVNLNTTPPMLDLPHMQAVARAGGYLEFASQSQRPSATLEPRNARSADLIRKLGPQHVILETDLGQVNNEPAPDGLAAFIMNLRAKGFTKEETDMMSKTNPAKLLGLPVVGGAAGRPPANVQQLMRGLLFPHSNVVFSAQSDDPATIKSSTRPSAATDPLTGAFGGWEAVANSALTLAESATLLEVDRRCSNGAMAPIHTDIWKKSVADLRAGSMAAFQAAAAKNQDGVIDATDKITESCSACHGAFRRAPICAG